MERDPVEANPTLYRVIFVELKEPGAEAAPGQSPLGPSER